MYSTLGDMLNNRHPLYQLANKINWKLFEESFSEFYSKKGRPCKPIRLMCGLLILKHLRNISDESIVEQWSENAYYQYFCGMDQFCVMPPCTPSELVHFRHRIKEEGDNLKFFQEISQLSVDITRKKYDNVAMECLSMGMSDDFADAIRAGSTMIRVGTAIFGARDYGKPHQ